MTDERYDIFISWAHNDGEENIIEIKNNIIENYKRFAPDAEALKIFTDHAIEIGDAWEAKIAHAISHSDLFIAILSPNYFKSAFCAHEMQLWKTNEVMTGMFNKASIPVYYIELNENPFQTENKAIKEAFIQQSNKKLIPWFNEGMNVLYSDEIKRRVEKEITSEKIEDKLKKIRAHKGSFTNAPSPNSEFVGRVTELTDIRLKLAERVGRIPLLHGAAGVGKTEIAFAYSSAYASEYPGGRYLIKSEGIKTIPDAFAKLMDDNSVCEELGLSSDTLTKEEKQNTEKLLRNKIRPALLNKKTETGTVKRGCVLIILDNVDNPYELLNTADVGNYLNWIPEDAIHIIATTRKDELTTSETDAAYAYPINEMADYNALELLRRKRKFDNDDEKNAAQEIVDFIDGNAWALSVIGDSLKLNQRYTYRRKADSLKQLKNVEYIREKDQRVKTRHGAINTEDLLNPTLDLLSEEERAVADWASLLHPDYVYMPWLKELFIKEYEEGEDKQDAEDDWLDVKEKLEKLHIISKEEESEDGKEEKQRCTRMHRLTGFVLRKNMTDEICLQTVNKLAEIINCHIKKGYKCVTKDEAYAIIQTASKWLLDNNLTKILAGVVSEFALYEIIQIYMPTSKEYLILLQESKRKMIETGMEEDIVLSVSGIIANMHDILGDYYEALKLREEILRKRKDTLGEEHTKTIGAMHNLANSYDNLGRYVEALKLKEEVLRKNKEILGEDHPDTISAICNLAVACGNLGRYEEALKLKEEVLRKIKGILGKDHLDTISAMHNLAVSYDNLGRYEEALKLKEEVLRKRKEVFGEDNSDTISAMHNLAVTCDNLGRYDEAFKLEKEALRKRKEIFGEDHPDTILAINNFAVSYDNLGRYDEALKLKEEVLRKRKEVFGEDHPDTISAMHNLAVSYVILGRYDEAFKLEEEALRKNKEILGEDHPNTIAAKDNLAVTYGRLGRHEEALKLGEEVLRKRKEILGEGHPDTIGAMNNIAWELRNFPDRLEEALSIQQKCVALSKARGLRKSSLENYLDTLALILEKLNRTDEAQKIRAEIEALKQQVDDPDELHAVPFTTQMPINNE